jgi:hypothetical protein
MEEVFAGFIVGFAFSIAIAPFAAYGIVRSSQETGLAQRFALGETNIVALAMFLQMLGFFLLTGIGMILGLALSGLEDRRPAGGLGSPNLAYTLIVLGLTAVLVIPILGFPWRLNAVIFAVLFAAMFGWVTPWLAQAA